MIRALVAQLDRASGYGPEGSGFEPLQAYHFFSPQKGYISPILANTKIFLLAILLLKQLF